MAFIGFGNLPTNVGGIVFIVLAIVLPLAAALIIALGLPERPSRVMAAGGFAAPAVIALWLWSQFPAYAAIPTAHQGFAFYSLRALGLERIGIHLTLGLNGISLPLFLLAGIVGTGVRALGGGRRAAAIGPSIAPCCYEVGEEVAAPFREAFGDDVVYEGRLDLWTSAERALRAAGVERVDRFDLCTACDERSFFSHRRDEGRTGRQGVIAYVA